MKLYKHKQFSPELLQQIRRDRPGIGLKESRDRIPDNPEKHVNVKWSCEYCHTRFFFRPEAICNHCGLCQTCGLHYDDPYATGCICGNHIPEDSPPIIPIRVRASVNNLSETESKGRV